MPSRSRTVATVLAMLAALVISAVVGISRLDSAGAAGGPIPGTAVMRLGTSWSLGSNYDRYSYLIVGRSSAAAAAAQQGESLVYHSAIGVNKAWDAGMPYSVASANNWLLRDASGLLLTNVSYPDYYIGDVGNPSYAAEYARRVGDYLAGAGVDGTYLDDVVGDVSRMTGGRYPAKYPNQAAWENALVSFIATVGSSLKARGFYVLLNAHKWVAGDPDTDNGVLEAEFWQRLGPSVSGLHTEFWLQDPTNTSRLRGDGPAWYEHWSGWANLVNVTQAMGRDFFGMTFGSTSNVQAMRYVRASHLLMWDGSGGGLLYQNPSGDPWSTEWTIDVGTPTAGRYQVGVGWRRQYSAGTVLVNPNTSSSQTFALGGTYLMPDGSSVTSVTLGPKSGLILRSTGSSAPVNTTLPAITGSLQQGGMLSASTGAWSGSPTSYAYQWNRCDTAGANCAAISGATSAQYTLGASDVGKTLRVKATASNASGSSSATSNATGVVAPPPPANLTLPSISGSAQQWQTLSSSTGTWTNSPTSYAYQWQRCDSGGNACAAVSGATAATFAVTSTDVGKTLRVVVRATNAGGSGTATSAASGVVGTSSTVVAAPVNTALPAISGSVQQGQTLSSSTGTWTNSPTSYAYQWQRCDSGGNACAAVSGATAATFAVTSTDVGKTLRVVVRATNAGGSGTATSAASGVVGTSSTLVAAPVNTALPAISGSVQQGQTLSSSTGTWTNSPTSYAYQWQRCDSGGNACAAVSGATAATFAVTSTDVGKTLRVVVRATNAGGSGTATSAASGVVIGTSSTLVAAPVNTALPAIGGTAEQGKTLTASTGSWSNSPTSYAYQWRRCDTGGGSCVTISGATASSLVLGSVDVGHTVRVAVTAANAGGSTVAASAASAVIAPTPAPAPPPPRVTNDNAPNVTGPERIDKTVETSNGSWSGNPTSYTYQWLRCTTDGLESCVAILGAVNASYTITRDDDGKYVIVRVTASNSTSSSSATSKFGRPIKN